MRNKIRLADYVMRYLKDKGVRDIFTVSGGGSIWLCDALELSKINYVCCHHEQAVGYAVEGYARSNKKVGVGLVTTGPGGTNIMSAVSACYVDSVPAVFISGQVYQKQTSAGTGLRQKGVQETNMIEIVKSNTKYAHMLTNPYEIKEILDYAFKKCQEGRPGPCWIDIPGDIQNTFIDTKSLKNKLKKKKQIDFVSKSELKKVEIVSKLISKSKKPIFLFGHGCRISKSEKIANLLVKNLKIPFGLTWNASDFLDNNHSLFIGKPGTFAERGSNFIVQSSDLIIAVGSRLPFMVTGYDSKDFGRNAKIVIVDIDKNELKNNQVNSHLKINLDANLFLNRLNKSISKKSYNKLSTSNWINYCKSIRLKYPILTSNQINQNKYVNSYFFVSCFPNVFKSKYQIITDMGLSFVGTHQALKVSKGQILYTNSGHAPMGWGLPAAIGAYFANKKIKTICFTGDGGLMMNLQELATVMHHKIPIIIFIFNNGGYLTIKQTQELGFNSRIMGANNKSGLSFPNFKNIAKVFKFKYFSISNNNEVIKKLKNIIRIKSPVVCELFIDPSQLQIPKAQNNRDKYGKTSPTKFENPFPFLSEDIVQKSYYDESKNYES